MFRFSPIFPKEAPELRVQNIQPKEVDGTVGKKF